MNDKTKRASGNFRQTAFLLSLVLCTLFILSPSKAYAWCADAVVNCADNCWAQTGGTGVLPETTAYCASHGGVAPFNCTGDIGNYCPDRPTVNASCSTASINQCNSGTLFDLTDTSTEYVWRCDGIGGGASVTCGASKPTPGWTSRGCGGSIVASFACNAAQDDRTCADNERLEYQVYTTNCPARNGWQTTRTRCIPDSSCTIAANAVCGAANGQNQATAPSTATDLCSVGSPTTVTGGATGPWNWSCNGVNGGTNASCSATYCPPPVDGVCDNSFINACSAGTSFDLADTATEYRWRCNGANGGANTNCSSPIVATPAGCIPTGMPVPDGQTQCPTSDCFVAVSGSGFSNPAGVYVGASVIGDPSNLIGAQGITLPPGMGDFQTIIGAGDYPVTAPADLTFNFGSPNPAAAGPVGPPNYPLDDANFIRQYPFSKAAHFTFDGIAIGTGTKVTLYRGTNYTGPVLLDVTGPYIINELWYRSVDGSNDSWLTEDWSSAVGIYRQFIPSTRHWSTEIGQLHIWSRGTSMRVSCPQPVNGACNNSFNNGCSAGTLNDTSDDASNYRWLCNGIDGGSTASCSMPRPVQVNGQCNNSSQNGCTAGTWADMTDDASNYYWRCNGTGGGSNDNCVMARPPAAVAGVCNNGTRNACSAGNSANQGEDATNFTWNCNGTGGGANASCAMAKPPSGPACAGNIAYSKQSFCADGRCEGFGYTSWTVDYSPSWIVNGNMYFSNNNVDPAVVNANPSTSKYIFPASNYYSTGAANPPPFTQTTDFTYKVSVTVGGVTRDLDFTVPRASRLTPVWAPSSGAWYEGPYNTTETVNGATCSLMSTLGHWASIGGIYSKHQSAQISCSCEGRPMTPPPTCGPAGVNSNGFNNATEVNNAGLCSNGGMSADVGGSGPWNWTCSSPNSGASVNCSTPRCVPSSETTVTCDGNGYDAVYDNCGTRKRIIMNPACDFDPWNPF